jgi:hypothetical protein
MTKHARRNYSSHRRKLATAMATSVLVTAGATLSANHAQPVAPANTATTLVGLQSPVTNSLLIEPTRGLTGSKSSGCPSTAKSASAA